MPTNNPNQPHTAAELIRASGLGDYANEVFAQDLYHEKDPLDVPNKYKPSDSDVGYTPKDFTPEAVQDALREAAKGGTLNLPRGIYNMGTTTLTATLSGKLTIRGSATLIWDSGDGIRLTQNNANYTVHYDGPTLLTKAPGTGVAYEIIGTAQNTGTGLQPRTKPRGTISNFFARGFIDTGRDGWGKAIRLVDIMNFSFNVVYISGYQPNQGNFVSTHGIEVVTDPANCKAVDITFDNLHIYLVQNAVDAQGYEGIMVDHSILIGVGRGVRFDALDAGAPLVNVTNSQIAFRDVGIEVIKGHQGNIGGNLIYTHSTSGAPETATGVSLIDSTTMRVGDNTFVSNNGMQIGVSITGSLSKRNVVDPNMYYSSIVTPVYLGSGTTDNKVRAQDVANPATQALTNLGGTGNSIEGNAAKQFLSTNGSATALTSSVDSIGTQRGVFLIQVNTGAAGAYALVHTSGSAISVISAGAFFAIANANPETAGKYNLYLNGASLTLNNRSGGTHVVSVTPFMFT